MSAQVGDGTTSVMILAGEMLSAAEPLLEPSRKIHPTKIVAGYMKVQAGKVVVQ